MTNKSQQKDEIKASEPSLDEFMNRLAQVSGEKRIAAILRWMDASPSSYANWRRRGTIPYNTIVSALLSRGLSLDWFFSPYKRLHIPALADTQVNEELQQYACRHPRRPGAEEIMQAYSRCKSLLKRYQLEADDAAMRTLLDMYFHINEQGNSRSEVLDYLARSLATGPHRSAGEEAYISGVNECSALQPDDK